MLLDSRLNLIGDLMLKENEAMFGGGISIDDSCLVSSLKFKFLHMIACKLLLVYFSDIMYVYNCGLMVIANIYTHLSVPLFLL